MKTILTAKLKLHTSLQQFQALRKTQLAYRDALNYVSQYAYEHGKMSNQQALQRGTYDEIRVVYGLPAQMACNVPRQVGATYKSCGQRLSRMLHCVKQASPRNVTRGLTNLPGTSLQPLPTTTSGTTR